jgi:hypothetical protein
MTPRVLLADEAIGRLASPDSAGDRGIVVEVSPI